MSRLRLLKRIASCGLCAGLVLATGCSRNERLMEIKETELVAGAEETSASENTGFDIQQMMTAMAELQKEIEGSTLFLPADSSEQSDATALMLMTLSCGGNATDTEKLCNAYGLEVVKQSGYDKNNESAAHTCAYTVAKGMAIVGNMPQQVTVVEIRGTSGGEWYSNFDVAPSGNYNSDYAENFLFAAEDVLVGIKELLEEDGIVIVSGHSRGAACANILGMFLNELMDSSRLYVYTSATPGTIKGKALQKEYSNIFNYINEGDLVPEVPLSQWGFRRAGKDIVLKTGKTNTVKDVIVRTLNKLADDTDDYYTMRYSLEKSGTDKMGITCFELMQQIAGGFMGMTTMRGEISDEGDEPGFELELDSVSDDSAYAELFALLKTAEKETEKLLELAQNHSQLVYIQMLKQTLEVK